MSSKFKAGEHVRVTDPKSYVFDQVGVICRLHSGDHSRWIVDFDGALWGCAESILTLADPDVHTTLDQMHSENAPEPNRRAKVLRTAESLVNGQRADDYGPPAENFGRVAAMWSAQFAAKLKEPLTADEVAIALVHLKLSRLANTPDHADSWIDACGYLALGAEIAEAAQ